MSLRVGIAARTGVTLVLICVLAVIVDWGGLGRQFSRIDGTWLLVAHGWLGLALLLGAARWWLLLRVQGIELSMPMVTRLTFVGLFYSLFMPGASGGDILKAYYVAKAAPAGLKTRAIVSVAADRLVGIFGFFLVSLVGLVWYASAIAEHPEAGKLIRIALWTVLGTVALVCAIVLACRRSVPAWLSRRPWGMRAREIMAAVNTALATHLLAKGLATWSVLTSGLVVLATCLAGSALADGIGFKLPLAQAAFVVSFTICVISLPISVAGHGIREGSFMVAFALVGIPPATPTTNVGSVELAVIFSLGFFGLQLVWGAIGGLALIGLRRSLETA